MEPTPSNFKNAFFGLEGEDEAKSIYSDDKQFNQNKKRSLYNSNQKQVDKRRETYESIQQI